MKQAAQAKGFSGAGLGFKQELPHPQFHLLFHDALCQPGKAEAGLPPAEFCIKPNHV